MGDVISTRCMPWCYFLIIEHLHSGRQICLSKYLCVMYGNDTFKDSSLYTFYKFRILLPGTIFLCLYNKPPFPNSMTYIKNHLNSILLWVDRDHLGAQLHSMPSGSAITQGIIQDALLSQLISLLSRDASLSPFAVFAWSSLHNLSLLEQGLFRVYIF